MATATTHTREAAIRAELARLCVENALFWDVAPRDLHAIDLAESGRFDSMALTFLQCAVDEAWGVSIAPALFLTKLRTLDDVARHVAHELSRAQRRGPGAEGSC